LYRYRSDDQWSFRDKQGVLDDLHQAIGYGFRYTYNPIRPPEKDDTPLPPVSTGESQPMPRPNLSWDNRLNQRGVGLQHYMPFEGETYFPVTVGRYYNQQEAGGRVNAYFDVVDEKGNRLVGEKVLVTWNGESAIIPIEAK